MELLLVVIYRAVITGAGAFCIFLGYKLFSIATERQGEFNLQSGRNQSLQLNQVAPGIFFALFGAIIIVASLIFHPSLHTKDSDLTLGLEPHRAYNTGELHVQPSTR